MQGGLIEWRYLFLTADGRSARGPFWIGIATLFAVSALYEAVAGATLHLLTFWFVYPALLGAAACVLSKRLHDRGRSGWWCALVLVAWLMIWPTDQGARSVVAWPVIVWAVVELGVMAGEQGANRYGPRPTSGVPGAYARRQLPHAPTLD